MSVRWLWGPVYKGLQLSLGRRFFWIGHTSREWKERGW